MAPAVSASSSSAAISAISSAVALSLPRIETHDGQSKRDVSAEGAEVQRACVTFRSMEALYSLQLRQSQGRMSRWGASGMSSK